MARRGVLVGALAAVAITTPLAAQSQPWEYRWYWGAKVGMLGYSTPTGGQVFTGQAGGEWLMTAKRTGLYVGYSQSFTAETDTFTVNANNRTITFDGFRRIQIGLVALIGTGNLQPYVGGGFSLNTLTNVQVQAGNTSDEQAAANAASIGILMMMGGVQYRMGPKLALYAHWQGHPGSQDFLLTGSINSFEGGVRYAFLPSRAEDPTTRR